MSSLAAAARGRISDRSLPLVVMAIVIVVWGSGPPFSKLITAPPTVAVTIRFAISVPLLFGLTYLRGHHLTREIFRRTALPGIAFGINLIFVFATLQEATIAVLSVVVSLQPALILIVAGRYFGERPTAWHVAFTVVGIGGAVLVIVGAGDEVRTSAIGLLWAVLSMLSFTIYFLATRIARSTTDVDPVVWMAGINVWSLAAAIPPVLVLADGSDWGEFGGKDWLWIVIVAYLTGVLGHVLMSWVHGYLEASRSSLYMLAMQIVAVGLAWPIHDEPITFVQVLGGMIVLGSVGAVISRPPRIVSQA